MNQNSKNSILKKIISSREFFLFIILVLLCFFIQYRNVTFFSLQNFYDLIKNYIVTILISLGMMMVIICGGIDLSVGSILALSGMSTAIMMRDGILNSTWQMILVGVIIGILCGTLNGLIITKWNVKPIVVTLGTNYIFRGATYLISNSEWVSAFQFQTGFKEFTQKFYLGFGVINNVIMIAILIYVIIAFIMKYTIVGRRIYNIGSNEETARFLGTNVNKYKLYVYLIAGLISGISGVLYTSIYASAMNNMGSGIEMDAIASCVIGGVNLNGGVGTVTGVLLGSIIMAIINKALPLIGISQFYKSFIKGIIILISVVINICEPTIKKFFSGISNGNDR